MGHHAGGEFRCDFFALGLDLRKLFPVAFRAFVSRVLLGINLFLLIYFVAKSFFVIYLSTRFTFSLAQANGMVSVFFVVIVISTIVVGFISDTMRVRKPFLLSGAAALIIVTLLFISRTGQPTSAALMSVLLAA